MAIRNVFAAALLAAAAGLYAQVLRSPVPTAATQPDVGAFDRFNRAHGNRWQVVWNRVTGTPHRVSGYYIDRVVAVTKNNVEQVARGFIGQNRDLLKADPASLALSKADFHPPQSKRTRGSGTWYVDFRQMYHRIRVEGGSVRVVIRGRRITSFGSDYFQGIDVPTAPRIPLERAIRIISKEPFKPFRTELIVYPDTRANTLRYHLAWVIITPVEHRPYIEPQPPMRKRDDRPPRPMEVVPVQWRWVVDAITGEILERSNLAIPATLSGHVTGVARPNIPTDPATPVDIAHMTVTVTQGATTTTATTDASGMYSFPTLAPGMATVSAQLRGPHTIVHNNETPDPDSTHSAVVALSATHDWDWSADDPSPSDVEEHAFYHADRIREWYLRGAPFNVNPDPDPMEVSVRDGAYCNAFAWSGGINFGSGTTGCQDFALCSDIFYHEYTHRIVDRVYTDAAVVLPYSGQSGAMNEAWADYFSCSLTNDPSHGEGCYSGRNIDTPDARYPDSLVGEVHGDGLIFSGAIWDTRAVLGAAYTDAMALRAMKDAALDFNSYLNAILEEDDDPSFDPDPLADSNLSNGTPNINTICHSYVDLHGIFDANCVGHTQSPIAIITAPPVTDYNIFPAATTSITITGTAGGSSQPFQSFTLSYATEAAPTTFLTAGVTLTGGGTAAVTAGTLGTLNITALADGIYIIRLLVTDTAGATATAQTTFAIDRTLMTGWPQALGANFISTPAVAELDPAAAGMEIAARGFDGNLYVWHKDGTLVSPFPMWAGWGYGSPAVGDLDHDGTLEIVTSDWYSSAIYAFHRDGTAVAGWPVSCGTGTLATPALSDLDGDGKLEVIVGSEGNQICAFHDNGTAVTGWPVATTAPVRSSAAVADLDHDGVPEIVVGSNDGKVYALHANGTALTGWPINVGAEVSGSPAVGDVDGDGNLEIVVATQDQKVYVWHHTGVALAGWPKSTIQQTTVPSSAVLADVDGDGLLDILSMSGDDNLYVWKWDGTPIAGFPPAGMSFFGYEFYTSSPAVGDIDGDGRRDVVAEGVGRMLASTPIDKVFAFHNDGTPVTGWPKIAAWYAGSSPVLTDVDLDGNVDVVIGAGGVFIWKLTTPFSVNATDWITLRADNLRTGAKTNAIDQQQPAMQTAGYTLAVGGNSQQKLAQVFTAGRSGSLTEVDIPIGCTAGADLVLSIENVTGGKPNGTVLTTQTFPTAGLPLTTFRRFVFTAPVTVTAGTQYAVVIYSTGLSVSNSCGIFQGPVGNPYAGGNMYFDSRPNAVGVWVCQCDFAGSAFDLPFIIYVQ